MSNNVRDVVIVGAGIGGPVLAMWLRRLGLEVVLAEARDSAALAEGAFLGVAPNGMNVLAELGCADAIAAHGHACDAFAFANGRGRPLGAIDRTGDRARFGWPLTMIRRGVLHALLAEEAVRRGVALRFGKRLVAIHRPRPDRVEARFADGSSATGDILIGADGLRSRVRGLVLPDAPPPRFTGLLDFGGFSSCARLPFPPRVNHMVFGSRAFFGAFTTPTGETWWFHNGPEPEPESESESEPAPGDATIRDRVLALHRDDPAWIGDVIRQTRTVLGPWPIHELDAMPRWSAGRVCLLGDAAHAMAPSAGQGASMAMEDAVVLAQCVRDIADPEAAFAAFERARRPRVDAMFKAARRNSSGKAASSRFAAWMRDRLLPMFLRFGASAQTESYAHRIPWEQRVA